MRAAFVPGIPKKEVYIMNVKKKIIAACIIALVLSAVVPIPLKNNYGKYDIAALAYRINRTDGGNRYLLFPENYESGKYTEHSFSAKVESIDGDTVTVTPLKGEDELNSSDKIVFSKSGLDDITVYGKSDEREYIVNIRYVGDIRETYPASIDAVSWSLEAICEAIRCF